MRQDSGGASEGAFRGRAHERVVAVGVHTFASRTAPAHVPPPCSCTVPTYHTPLTQPNPCCLPHSPPPPPQPRLVPLPSDRHNDLRPARHAALCAAHGHGPDTATSHLGPGAYAPLVSPGGPRGGRRTYRLFVDPATHPQPSDRFGGGVQEDAASVVRAHGRGHRGAGLQGPGQQGGLGSPRSPRGSGGDGSLTARSVGSSSVGGGGAGVGRLGASSSFAGPFRSQCSGAYHGRMDSSLVRRH